MCLITVATAAKTIDAMLNNRPMIESIFESNSDGLGAMYRNKKGLRVVKVLPRDLKDCLEFFHSMPKDDRMLAVHWRMKTHGRVDLTNCHPYDVVEGKVAMMHNGILHTGNAADPTKSDTWHFIKDFLAKPVAKFPGLVHDDTFLEMCGEYIDSNRFVFMDDEGRLSIVNRDQGVEHDGMWFANTYAWEPSTFIPTYPKKSKWYGSYTSNGAQGSFRGHLGYDYDDESGWAAYYRNPGAGTTKVIGGPGVAPTTGFKQLEFINNVHSANVEYVSSALSEFPVTAVRALLATHRASVTRSIQNKGGIEQNLTGKAFLAAEHALAADGAKLEKLTIGSPHAVAETFCYYLDWTETNAEREENSDPEEGVENLGNDTSGVYPTCRYLGCEVYVDKYDTANGPRYSYSIYDPEGCPFTDDDGFTTPEEARQCAIDDIAYFEDRLQEEAQEELDAEAEFADRAMDLAACSAAERDTMHEE